MKITVIHNPERLDRAAGVGALHARFPQLLLTYAQRSYEPDRQAAAVRGCSLSHLLAVRSLLSEAEPLLVLEDDAQIDPEGLKAFLEDYETYGAPAADIVLLGAETEAHGATDPRGYTEVVPPFFGTHAVLYLPSLLRSEWLLNAYAVAATNPVGQTLEGHIGLCYESILCIAAQQSSNRIVRPQRMAFTTMESFSDREGAMMPGRTKNTILNPKTNENYVDTNNTTR